MSKENKFWFCGEEKESFLKPHPSPLLSGEGIKK
jgi:hypothetical protein